MVALIVLTAIIGTLLATPGLPPLDALVFGNLGIALAAASAAAVNHALDRKLDARMGRTRNRPLPTGHLSLTQALRFALVLGVALDDHPGRFRQCADGGADLRLADRLRGGLHGLAQARDAAEHRHRRRRRRGPPVLGWVAVTNHVSAQALLLFLIIFAWTPPHFWALAIARRTTTARADIPMLPVTHGVEFTRLHVLLYTVILCVVTLLPYVIGMSGLIYLVAARGAECALPVAGHRAEDHAPRRSADAHVPLLDQST